MKNSGKSDWNSLSLNIIVVCKLFDCVTVVKLSHISNVQMYTLELGVLKKF